MIKIADELKPKWIVHFFLLKCIGVDRETLRHPDTLRQNSDYYPY